MKGLNTFLTIPNAHFLKGLKQTNKQKILKRHCWSTETFSPYSFSEVWIDYPEI